MQLHTFTGQFRSINWHIQLQNPRHRWGVSYEDLSAEEDDSLRSELVAVHICQSFWKRRLQNVSLLCVWWESGVGSQLLAFPRVGRRQAWSSECRSEQLSIINNTYKPITLDVLVLPSFPFSLHTSNATWKNIYDSLLNWGSFMVQGGG